MNDKWQNYNNDRVKMNNLDLKCNQEYAAENLMDLFDTEDFVHKVV